MKDIRPVVVVGFGGYPTFPPLLAARQLGIPTMLHEQNAVLGRANKMLARRVDAIATSFETTKFLDGALLAKARFTGNPVRAIVIDAAAVPYPTLQPDGPFHLLVFGGSQGARYFSDAVPPALAFLPNHLKSRIKLVQQAREEDVDRVRSAYSSAGIAAEIAPFFKDLPARMAASHLVIGRAGASSVAELTVIGRPSILVPLPHSLDNDQLQNATRLAESGGAWCIEQKTLSPERLGREFARLMEGGAALYEAAECAKRQGRPDAVVRLAALVEELAGTSAASAAVTA
jgi:UDP-N-acetylglucosamine--N-acetylmuramyl-(pentapeptide) pyrophosphoryl-undecaprenol N-acetylglucosamine transferase